MHQNNSLVFYGSELYWLSEKETNDTENDDYSHIKSYVLTDSNGGNLFITDRSFSEIRKVNEFTFRLAYYLRDYTHEMSKAGVLNYHTVNVFKKKVLDFIDEYSEKGWNEESIAAYKELYGYKDRLLTVKMNYEKEMGAVR